MYSFSVRFIEHLPCAPISQPKIHTALTDMAYGRASVWPTDALQYEYVPEPMYAHIFRLLTVLKMADPTYHRLIRQSWICIE